MTLKQQKINVLLNKYYGGSIGQVKLNRKTTTVT